MVDSDTHEQLVIFSLGGEEYGFPIAHVQGIIRYTEPRSVRGKTIPVCDLAARLGVASDPARIVVLETAAGVAGVGVDEVHEVVTVAAAAVRRPGDGGHRLVERLAEIEDRVVPVLDASAILAGADLGAVA